jgi:phosphotriesterase-related protein
MIQTAAGLQPLNDGIIYAHEHLCIDLTTERDQAGKLDQFDAIIEEVSELKRLGVAAILEQTCLGMGRNVARLREIQEATGVQIIPATGYYHKGFHPPFLATATIDEIAHTLEQELLTGMDGTGVRPMLLGEIGGTGSPPFPEEATVFRAAAQVARKYPVLVTTHAHLGTGGQDELDLLLEGGVEPARILIGHQDLCPSLDTLLHIAEQGAYLGFDTVGKTSYAPDERRVEYIKAFVQAGLHHRILLSCDISRNPYLRKNGGQGYAYLIQTFLPMLRAAGVSEEAIYAMTVENPRAFLAGAGITKG